MIKKHIIPAIGAIVVFLILWGLMGQVVMPLIDIPNKFKGLVIIVVSIIGAVLTNNLLSKRSGK